MGPHPERDELTEALCAAQERSGRTGELPSWRNVVLLDQSLRRLAGLGSTATPRAAETYSAVHRELTRQREELLADPTSRVLPHAAARVLRDRGDLTERVEDWLTHLARGESLQWSRSRASRWERFRGRSLLCSGVVSGADRLLLVSSDVPGERSELARVSHPSLLSRGHQSALVVEATVALGQVGDAGQVATLDPSEVETALGLWDPGGAGPLATGSGARRAAELLHR